VAINMGDDNLVAYERYFQFHDPITYELQKRRGPTLVTQVMPQADLLRTEFYNDFLARDGLYHGVNLFAYAGDHNIGDLRIWRGRQRASFDRDTLTILSLIEPAFTRALARNGETTLTRNASQVEEAALLGLSPRERAIARLICNGRSDKEIAQELDVAFSTVRTHLSRIFEKLNVHNRTQLAKRLLGPQ
jgi:DNA-binding CsgD family transcriptional regulator